MEVTSSVQAKPELFTNNSVHLQSKKEGEIVLKKSVPHGFLSHALL